MKPIQRQLFLSFSKNVPGTRTALASARQNLVVASRLLIKAAGGKVTYEMIDHSEKESPTSCCSAAVLVSLYPMDRTYSGFL